MKPNHYKIMAINDTLKYWLPAMFFLIAITLAHVVKAETPESDAANPITTVGDNDWRVAFPPPGPYPSQLYIREFIPAVKNVARLNSDVNKSHAPGRTSSPAIFYQRPNIQGSIYFGLPPRSTFPRNLKTQPIQRHPFSSRVPQVWAYSAPSIQPYSAPSIQPYNAPSMRRYNAPSMRRYNAPSIQPYNTPPMRPSVQPPVGYPPYSARHHPVPLAALPKRQQGMLVWPPRENDPLTKPNVPTSGASGK